MNIFEFAMEKERYSELYYRDLAQRSNNEGLKNILMMLAEEEAKHYRTVEQMKAGTTGVVPDTRVLGNAKRVFEKMRKAAEKYDFHVGEADLYRKAAKIEEESRRFYDQKARETTDPAQKKILQKLAQEEEKHMTLMENLCSFVSRPETYLEDAEFSHFDDYVDGEF
ncbi:MAG TPA: ferritin family protein [Sedimentisphaerales bacterium]|nr:ferritin family protein [Sedimentisphaerales bacterium]